MSKEVFTLNGVRFFSDVNTPKHLLYPTGYKDGNKLGKRKRNLSMFSVVFQKDNNTAFTHPEVIEKLKKDGYTGGSVVC